jgi:RhtB (resistance to homoserine/threonine) family protein
MIGITHFETFVITGILLNLTPGNDTIFILTKSIAQGKKAGIISALGIATGSIIHTLLAAFGLSLIIAQSMVLFNIIKYIGAAYLLYIGFKMLTDKSQLQTDSAIEKSNLNYWKVYRDGMLTNIFNPKVALFFIAFLPQFIDPSFKQSILPFVLLGLTFTTTGAIWCFVLAIFASTFFGMLKENKTLSFYINKACGLALIALGVKVAITSRE